MVDPKPASKAIVAGSRALESAVQTETTMGSRKRASGAVVVDPKPASEAVLAGSRISEPVATT